MSETDPIADQIRDLTPFTPRQEEVIWEMIRQALEDYRVDSCGPDATFNYRLLLRERIRAAVGPGSRAR